MEPFVQGGFMKKIAVLGVFIMGAAAAVFAQRPVAFDRYFIDQTMRVDYFHIGNAKEEMVTLDQVRVQGVWAGSRKNLLDEFDNGKTYVKVYDLASGALIFSRGFDTYFGEYQTTDAALKGTKRTYHESALIPCPKAKVTFALGHGTGRTPSTPCSPARSTRPRSPSSGSRPAAGSRSSSS